MTEFKFLGHATIWVNMNGKKLLFDPFISPNPAAKDIDIDGLEVDYILLSHGHGDHVADLERIAKNTGALLISSFELVSYYEEMGIKGHPMNTGGKKSFDFGTVKLVNAVHSNKMPDGSYGGPNLGFVVWNQDICFYYAGDTALTMDMKLIPLICPPLDLAILPVGDNFTMGYEDAILACDFIQCDKVLGMHFDTFGYIEIDHQEAVQAFKTGNKELVLPEVGSSITIGQ